MRLQRFHRRKRTGTILAVSLALLTIVMLMVAAVAKNMLLVHRQAQSEEMRQQAQWLADAGSERAVRALKSSPTYEGETWQVSGFPDGVRGIVSIQVQKEKIVVQATFPEEGKMKFVSNRELPRD